MSPCACARNKPYISQILDIFEMYFIFEIILYFYVFFNSFRFNFIQNCRIFGFKGKKEERKLFSDGIEKNTIMGRFFVII